MATELKPVLGYRLCPDCGERGTIHQAGGRRGSLYQRCGCGCVQSNGPLVQSRMWYETDWLPDLKPDPAPAKVLDPEQYQQQLLGWLSRNGLQAGQIDRPDRAAPEFQPGTESGQQTDSGPDSGRPIDRDEPVKTGRKKGALLLALAAVSGLVVVVLRAARPT